MSFTGSQQFKVVRGLPAICYYAAVRPSDQAICVACYDSTFTYLSIVSSSNGSALAKVSWKTSGKSRFVSDDDRVAAVALDSQTEDFFVAGQAFGTGTLGTQPANNQGQASLTKIYAANYSQAYVQVFGPTIATSAAFGVAFSGASRQVYAAGTTAGAFGNQAYNGGLSDAFVNVFDANGTHLWTRIVGTNYRDDFVYVTDYLGGCICAGGYFQDTTTPMAIMVSYMSNGTSLWPSQLLTSKSYFSSLQVVRDQGFVYAAGDFSGSLDGQTSGGYDFLMTRYHLGNGSRDNWQILLGLAQYDEIAGHSTIDVAVGKVAMSGWISANTSTYATIATAFMNGTIINYAEDIIMYGQSRGNVLTSTGVLVISGFDSPGGFTSSFVALDDVTFARPLVTSVSTTNSLAPAMGSTLTVSSSAVYQRSSVVLVTTQSTSTTFTSSSYSTIQAFGRKSSLLVTTTAMQLLPTTTIQIAESIATLIMPVLPGRSALAGVQSSATLDAIISVASTVIPAPKEAFDSPQQSFIQTQTLPASVDRSSLESTTAYDILTLNYNFDHERGFAHIKKGTTTTMFQDGIHSTQQLENTTSLIIGLTVTALLLLGVAATAYAYSWRKSIRKSKYSQRPAQESAVQLNVNAMEMTIPYNDNMDTAVLSPV